MRITLLTFPSKHADNNDNNPRRLSFKMRLLQPSVLLTGY